MFLIIEYNLSTQNKPRFDTSGTYGFLVKTKAINPLVSLNVLNLLSQ